MDPFLDQLKGLCAAHPTRAKWVFVPSHAIGRTIGERIALDGTNWLNLRFVTPLDIALRMGAPFLVERGIDPSEEGLGPALMMRLLLDLPEEGGYFRPLADQPTLAQALCATVRELRMAGVKSDDLKPEAFESPAKHAELRALLRSYEGFLARTTAATWRGLRGGGAASGLVSDSAAGLLDRAAGRALDSAAATLMDVMPGRAIMPRLRSHCRAQRVPRRLESGRDDRQAQRLAPKRDAASAGVPDVVRRRCSRAGANVLSHRSVPRRRPRSRDRRGLPPHPAAGAPLDQVEIACASDAHVALVWEKALRHEWPVTLARASPPRPRGRAAR